MPHSVANPYSERISQFVMMAQGRVAYQIWVVMEASEAAKFSTSGNLKAEATPEGISITAGIGGATENETKITLSAKSTYAYLLAKPERRNGVVSSFTTDQQGI